MDFTLVDENIAVIVRELQMPLCRQFKWLFILIGFIFSVQLYLGFYLYRVWEQTKLRNGFIHGDNPVIRNDEEDLLTLRTSMPTSYIFHDDYLKLAEIPEFNSSCIVTDQKAISALKRSSPRCQSHIQHAFCALKGNALFPKALPRTCPLQDRDAGRHLGCFRDNLKDRDFSHVKRFTHDNSPHICVDYCYTVGFRYAGLQYGEECFCGQSYGKHGKADPALCDSICPGDQLANCGGHFTSNIYTTGVGIKESHKTVGIKMKDLLPVERKNLAKIVFAFSLNGRAVRQILRLFKALYHTRHYYIFHVDSRQHYLYRELSKLADKFPNVRMTTFRMSTIWGGASLSTMYIRTIKDLLRTPDWDWDFFINLSESDYPLKPFDELVAYLTRYRDMNFLRSHGVKTFDFLRKQGIDQTFVECDAHMYWIGGRKVPSNVRIDGGSDWFVISRKLSEYIGGNRVDHLVAGLLQYYKYSLLSAESFFHTVLMNSKFCTHWVDNSLRMINWDRKRGCKCQTKTVVDWCGCSPMVFQPRDYKKIMRASKWSFFARKFDPIISQEAINMIDASVFGSETDEEHAISSKESYWENIYHHEDKIHLEGDTALSFYHTLMTIANHALLKSRCHNPLIDVLEVSVFQHFDSFSGLAVLFRTSSSTRFEALFVPSDRKFTVHASKALPPFTRLIGLEVGNRFDMKEQIFRNYASIMGVNSELQLRHEWGESDHGFDATFKWVKPSGQVAGVSTAHVGPNSTVIATSAPLASKQPKRPGVWTVKLVDGVTSNASVAEAQFLVVPRIFKDGQMITDRRVASSLNGNIDHIFTEYKHMSPQDAMLKYSEDLLSQFWSLQEICTIGAAAGSDCNNIRPCADLPWSSKSSDPKSSIGSVNKRTGRLR